jgi:hypothetical protein
MAAMVLVSLPASPALGWTRFVLLVVGSLAAGGAVAIRPASSAVLGLAAFSALLASLGCDWDSACLVYRVLTVVSGLAALLVLCSREVRRVVVSLLILIHFGGILTAVSSASQSWLAQQMWTYFYRPYLLFMYLNNAYHFYSPEPGPAPLLWFCIEYEPDQEGRNLRWVKVPELDKDGIPRRPDGTRLWPNVQYTRRLSMAESANFPGPPISPVNFINLLKQRVAAGDEKGIPLRLDVSYENQYREPSDVSKLWLQTYVRHVARAYPHETKPYLQVTGVKVYRVIHDIIHAGQLAQGLEPNDPTLYFPFYMGEFDQDGNIKPSNNTVVLIGPNGEFQVKRDPFLYWLIPIMRPLPKNYDPTKPFYVRIKEEKVKNYVLLHAGDVDRGDLP